jgi:hypothetical protein
MATLVWIAVSILVVGCGGDDGSASDAGTGDTDSSSDTDQDTELDLDCSECTSPVCISTISGRALYADGSPVQELAEVKVCIPNCCIVTTDSEGYFEFVMPGGCRGYDFATDDALHLSVPAYSTDQHVHYIVAYTPTQEQVSDLSPDDFDLDVGVHYFYDAPEQTSAYTPETGASVDLDGVQIDIQPGELGDEDLEIGALRFPIDEWVPPFVDNPLLEETVGSVDVLYFFVPYWTGVAEGTGLVLSIEPPDGWTEVDTGKVYVLGDFVLDYLYFPDETIVPRGEFVEWGDTSYLDGRLLTPPIPRLGWIGLKKD